MTNKSSFIRLVKNVVIFTSPVWILAILYFVFDPFHVLKPYDAYPDNYLKSYNRNRISTQIFLNNNQDEQYDSFILGNSKSSVFYTEEWAKYLDPEAKTYHFDASNEVISGIYGKIKFIDKQGNDIKNALLILDPETFEYAVDTANSIIHIQDYEWSGLDKFSYQLIFFKAFFKNMYFIKYFDVKLFGKYRPYMYGAMENKHMLYTPVRNDFIFQGYIDQIKEDSLGYYSRDLFYTRPDTSVNREPVIKPYQKVYLEEIKQIFDKNHTDYKIVFGPNYDQKHINEVDLAYLKKLFGDEHVYDYTGINELTSDLKNYYEIFHYKPVVARKILADIYGKPIEKK